jgi:hypothetical protein
MRQIGEMDESLRGPFWGELSVQPRVGQDQTRSGKNKRVREAAALVVVGRNPEMQVV